MITNPSALRASRVLIVTRLAALLFAALLCAMSTAASAQQSFKAPEEASEALAKAARDKDTKALLRVLGKDGEDIVSSGDPVEDAAARDKFLAAYDAKHEIKADGDKATMIVGKDDFPFPIPLVRKKGQWVFDTEAGRVEILARRIGRNELDTIQTCLAYVDAQNDYAEKDRTGAGPGVYAQRIVSTKGKKDGLYWPAAQGEDESPLGELAARATAQGYRAKETPQPFHGYYYKILKRQGASAPGGAMNYVAQGKMIGGFALVAWPAEYGNSGITTFMVNHAGTVYQKDLGPRTEKLAPDIEAFNPDKTWTKTEAPSAAAK
jgi:DUF2950 family protein